MNKLTARRITKHLQRPLITPQLQRSFSQALQPRSDKPPAAKSAEHNNPFTRRPGPPPLPPDEQREFEELVRKAQAPLSVSPKTHTTQANVDDAVVEAVTERHPDARKPIPPEFEGDVNPVTGERGGPKREPVKHNDWSYGGKVTDF
jgi:hypothetical protein